MTDRREFLKNAALLSGGMGLMGSLPASIQKAFVINPDTGSTYLDAEHIVFLMQENRSFDHCYGTLQGVRGFNDPRAISLPNKNKVWAQTNAEGETYTPFRLDLKDSKITWLGSLPHSWDDMTMARNEGHHDKWLDAKRSGREECKNMPLTMGHFTRADIPFYYALADAFTVCDQHFCSSLTGTTPNRLHFWTGTLREKHDEHIIANVYNADVDYGKEAGWKTFPEYLEENNISWKIYQNEVSIDTGFEGEEEDWLANFTDNPIEWFKQFNIRFAKGHIAYLQKAIYALPEKIKTLQDRMDELPADDTGLPELKKQLEALQNSYGYVKDAINKYTPENFNKLSPLQKNLHEKAFCNNSSDADYRSLETITYDDNGAARTMQAPKGDVLYQLREDVKNGRLPTVSWVVAPSHFSDHPGSPWYGAWYLSEVFDILTQNPGVWKKTIFILNYDENDGYFDHVPPFVPPNPYKENSGKVSASVNTREEYVNRQQSWMRADDERMKKQAEGPVGLGFRVPLVIASPWSRGGWVNSEVCDLTSPIQFMEHFLSHKTGKKIYSNEVNGFRRAICSNLSSVFRPYNGENIPLPNTIDKIPFLESIHKAQFKALPSGYKKLAQADIDALNINTAASPFMPKQEKGTRPACAIPYQLYVEGRLNNNVFSLQFDNRKDVFGDNTAGAPFIVYDVLNPLPPRNYVVLAGDTITDTWQVNADGNYHLRINGPNGFFRECIGNKTNAVIEIVCHYQKAAGAEGLSGNIELSIKNRSAQKQVIEIIDNAYKAETITQTIAANAMAGIPISLNKSSNWYDVSVKIKSNKTFERRYAGHVETGKESITDPLMGGVVV
ncbi:phosphocholine-specific phospholipase C [Parafilimonas sp.]|uniref:phosphocholine-specific phospholipase C n=1 Tax=Parafilimonas sp. TaxID=1969739 RepID=UPI0039E5F411